MSPTPSIRPRRKAIAGPAVGDKVVIAKEAYYVAGLGGHWIELREAGPGHPRASRKLEFNFGAGTEPMHWDPIVRVWRPKKGRYQLHEI